MYNQSLEAGDLVKRIIKSHYTNYQPSETIGVVIRADIHPLVEVYFPDNTIRETWNKSGLRLISKVNNENR